MNYIPTDWKDHVAEHPRRYSMLQNSDGTVLLTPSPGEITQAGTPQNAQRFNHIEQGIADIYNLFEDNMWWPDIASSGTNPYTITFRESRYQKIGPLVFAYGYFAFVASGSSSFPVFGLLKSSLPFAPRITPLPIQGNPSPYFITGNYLVSSGGNVLNSGRFELINGSTSGDIMFEGNPQVIIAGNTTDNLMKCSFYYFTDE